MIVAFPPFLRLALLSSAAAGAAYAAGDIIGGDYVAAVPAAVAAVSVTSTTAIKAWKMSILQVIGIGVGAALALLAVEYLGYSPLTIALLVAVSYGIVALLRLVPGFSAPKAAASIAVSVIIVLGSHYSTGDAIDRFLGVVAGSVIGLIFSFFAATNMSLDDIAQEVDELSTEVGDLSADIASGLAMGGVSHSTVWAERAVDIRHQHRSIGEELTDLDKTSRWSPLISQKSADRLKRRYDALGMTITRLVAVTSDLETAERSKVLEDAPTGVIKPLAQLFEDVSESMKDGGSRFTRSDVTKQTSEALQAASGSHLETQEIMAISGLAQSAGRLISLEDTQPMEPIRDDNPESQP